MKKKSPKDNLTRLKEVWYRKLERSGFKDIEHDENNLIDYSSSFNHNKRSAKDFYAKSEYYSMAGQFLNEFKFKSKLQKIIWEYHSNGVSARNIAKVLAKTRVSNLRKSQIWNILKPLVAEMKRMYLFNG